MSQNGHGYGCQGCGRCSQATSGEGWRPLEFSDDAAAAMPDTSWVGTQSAAGVDLAALVRDVVREAVFSRAGASATEAGPVLDKADRGFEIPVGISVRHVHICQKDMDLLFGPGSHLSKKSDLYEPGEFAAKEVLTIVGPKLRAIENVRILGPMRDFTQVELSHTDGIYLGLNLPMRRSGDLTGAAPLTLIGPAGSLTLPHVAIRSNRHIHMSDKDAARFSVSDNDIVRVRVPGEEGVIYENVQVRVNPNWLLTMHVDTDDANASNLFCQMKAYLLPPRWSGGFMS